MAKEIFVDTCRENYRPCMPKAWAASIAEKSKVAPELDTIIIDLATAWRSISFTTAMPAKIVNLLIAFADSYVKTVTPESSIVNFGQAAIRSFVPTIPELVDNADLALRLQTEFVGVLHKLQAASNTTIEFSEDHLWQQYLELPQFQMMLWSSQRVGFIAFYNAYEACLVRILRTKFRLDRLRTTDGEFGKRLQEFVGERGLSQCWGSSRMYQIREIRNALTHAGGREIETLKKAKHGIEVHKGELQIYAKDNHKLVEYLQKSVDLLVEQAKDSPEFQ